MSDKQIKIDIVVSQDSAGKAKRLIQEINSEIATLLKNATAASAAMGSMGGVRGGTGSVGAGTGGTNQASAQGTNGGIFAGLAAGVGSIKMALMGSKAVFKDISDGLKLFSDQANSSKTPIDSLTTSLKNLNAQLIDLKGNAASVPGFNMGGGGGGSGGASGGSGSGNGGTPVTVSGGASGTSAAAVQAATGSGGRGRGGGGGGRGGMGGGIVGALAQNSGLGGGIGGIAMAALGMLSNPIALGVGAVVGAYSLGNTAMQDNINANLGQELDKPFWASKQAAAAGSTFGSMYFAMRDHGDIGTSMAISRLAKRNDEQAKYFTDPTYREKQALKIGLAAGDPEADASVGNLAGAAKDKGGRLLRGVSEGGTRGSWAYRAGKKLRGALGMSTEASDVAAGPISETPAQKAGIGNDSAIEISKSKGFNELKIQQIQEFAGVAAREKLNPLYMKQDRAVEQMYNESESRISMMRMGGFSDRSVRTFGGDMKNGVMANPGMLDDSARSSYNMAEIRMIEQGRDMGQLMSARGNVGRGVAWGLKGLGERSMGIGEGGFSAFNTLARFGAMTGDGRKGAGQMVSDFQSVIGRGGLDTVAASGLFSNLAQSASRNRQFGVNYGELMKGAADVAWTGTPGGDLRGAEMVEKGFAAQNRTMSGSTDNLQKLLNARSAWDVVGDKGYGAVRAIQKVGAENVFSMLRANGGKGKISDELGAAGVTIEDLKAYQKSQNKELLIRSNLGGKLGGVVDEARKIDGGDPVEYIRRKAKGINTHTAEGRKELRGMMLPMATAMALSADDGTTAEDHMGAIGIQLGYDSGKGGLLSGLRGGKRAGGASGPALTPTQKAIQKGKAELKKEERKAQDIIDAGGAVPDVMQEHIKGMTDNVAKMEGAAKGAAGAVDMTEMSAVMTTFVGIIKKVNEDLGAKTPSKPQKAG